MITTLIFLNDHLAVGTFSETMLYLENSSYLSITSSFMHHFKTFLTVFFFTHLTFHFLLFDAEYTITIFLSAKLDFGIVEDFFISSDFI